MKDRPGHDRRYRTDARKIESDLGCKQVERASPRQSAGTSASGMGGERDKQSHGDRIALNYSETEERAASA
jgi:hypothetical protein